MARLMQGNEAVAEGALAAGVRFFAGYPITPSTEIAEIMAERLPRLDGKFIQMEDEIASLHFIHAARRNIDITVLLFNNNIYGMTGGQYSPLTPLEKKATTAPYGTIEPNFDVAELARSAGASYVGRGTTYHTGLLTNLITAGIENKGFSLIEAVTACPTAYG